MGYHSTSELSPFSPRFSPINPPASSVSPGLQTSTSLQAGLSQQSAAAARVPALIKEAQKSATLSSSYQYQPKIISISPKLIPKAKNQHYSSSGNLLKDGLHKDLLNLRSYHLPPITKAVTIDQIDRIRDPVDDFLRNNIYKTKVVTTVFESVKGGFEELIDDVEFEIDKWFGKSSILAVACEVHFSVPEDKRNRQLECRMKEKILAALRENNKRLLYLKGLGLGKLPIPLAESKTHENIMKDWDTNSVRGVYQRYYARLLPYVYPETPNMHSPFWKLQ
ncbi:hypothetical protein WR25_01067 [Diploscapter pachys]|uniref:Uncharacterized protein n=1 Tax=Diploscapter pachys TaxID=2018661 RepID=A0A2A2JT41_9BILA|nr:hypothetical protein WR25_01067 [Diploscapter pachys]